MTGACKYCGQIINVEAETQEQADERASAVCTCSGAEHIRVLTSAAEILYELTEPGCEKYGFKALNEKQQKTTDEIFRSVVEGIKTTKIGYEA